MAESDYIKIGDEYAEITSDAEGGVVLEIVELPPDMVPNPVPTPVETPVPTPVETPVETSVETPTTETLTSETEYLPGDFPVDYVIETPTVEPPTPQAQQIPIDGELPTPLPPQPPVIGGVTVVTPGNTISFSEKSKGWVSFKTIDPEVAFSLNNKYYTAKGGKLWKHHDDSVDRNSFYQEQGTINNSSFITVLFNDLPSVVKSFTTLNYEGSQSRIIENLAGTKYGGVISTDNKYYNNQPELGWYVNSVTTDKQTGTIAEFINKEGKWFNYIIGEETVWENGGTNEITQAPITGASGNLDTKEFSTQGIGMLTIPLIISRGPRTTPLPAGVPSI